MPNLRKIECLFIVFLFCLASFVRLWQFESFVTFLDDQGRDALVALHILKNGDVALLGPTTSVGSMYLGPLYYYWMVPWLALSFPNPVGVAYPIAIMGVVTVLLVYVWGKHIVGRAAAAVGAVMLASAPAAVELSRFSWQPNPGQIVGMILLYALWRARSGSNKAWIVVSLCVGLIFHIHYVALLSLLPVGWVWWQRLWKTKNSTRATFLRYSFVGALIVLASISPLILFDIRHDGLLRRGFMEYFVEQSSGMSLWQRLMQIIADMHGRGMYLFIEFWGITKEVRVLNTFLFLLGVALFALIFLLKKPARPTQTRNAGYVLLWVFSFLFGLSVFRGSVYPHYFAYAFPAIALSLGIVVTGLLSNWWAKIMVVVVFSCVSLFTATRLPYWRSAPGSMRDVYNAVQAILPYLPEHGSYNLAYLDANRQYKANRYRYFFEALARRPEDQYSYQNLDYLVVFNETRQPENQVAAYEVRQFWGENDEQPRIVKSLTYQGIVDITVYGRR